jgi:hypothetical protein
MRSCRRFLVLGGLAAAVPLLLCVPAFAKGLPGEPDLPLVRNVVVSGGTLSAPISFSGQQATDFASAAGIDRAFQLPAIDSGVLVPPRGAALGPRFQVMYAVSPETAPRIGLDGSAVTQDLYPFAAGGAPWAYTPPARGLHASGWWPVAPQIVSMLKDAGVTARPLSVTDGAPTAPAPSASGWALWLSLGIVPLLALTEGLARRYP